MLRLKRYLSIKGIPIGACAKFLDITEKTFRTKMAGETQFSYSEVCKLRELLPEYNIDYLLSEADDSA